MTTEKIIEKLESQLAYADKVNSGVFISKELALEIINKLFNSEVKSYD